MGEPAPATVVRAGQTLPADCRSAVVELDALTAGPWTSPSSSMTVGVDGRGRLTCPGAGGDRWPLAAEVAPQCRAQNVECVLLSDRCVAFATTRRVERGQPLRFWFSETMLARLEMPFLSPRNIQGSSSSPL